MKPIIVNGRKLKMHVNGEFVLYLKSFCRSAGLGSQRPAGSSEYNQRESDILGDTSFERPVSYCSSLFLTS